MILTSGFVHEISIDPDTAPGVITFYELPISSLIMMAPGVGLEPTRSKGQGILRPREEGSEQRTYSIRCPFFRPYGPRRVVQSEDYGHPDGHLLQDPLGSLVQTVSWPEVRGVAPSGILGNPVSHGNNFESRGDWSYPLSHRPIGVKERGWHGVAVLSWRFWHRHSQPSSLLFSSSA